MADDAMNRFSLRGRLVLMTCGSSGLGQHFARLLATQGARVAVAARHTDKLQGVVGTISAVGGQARAYASDVTDSVSVRACFDELATWDVPGVLINNAGVTVTRALLEQTEADFDQVLDTNLKDCWLVATKAASHMVAAGKGARSSTWPPSWTSAWPVAWRRMRSPKPT